MKLNPDCIRDIMLYLEDCTYAGLVERAGHDVLGFNPVAPKLLHKVKELEIYDYAELVYHILQLSESEYIVTNFQFDPKSRMAEFTLSAIYYITPKGHELIARIKDENAWSKKIKPLLKSFGSISLSIIEAIASGLTTTMISNYQYPEL